MKKRILTTLFASLVCLGLFLPQARAENPHGLTAPAKPDLEITSAEAKSKLLVAFTIVSRGADVPANTVTVYVTMSAPGTTNTIWDDHHPYVIGQPLQADVPAEFTIQMPEDKSLENKYLNVLVDPDNKVDESNEQNNVSKNFYGPPKSSEFPSPINVEFKDAIYFRLGQPDSQAGEPGKALRVKKSQTQSCTNGWCAVLTVRFQKDPAKYLTGLIVKVKNLTTGDEQNGDSFIPEGETMKDFTFVITLKDGENKLRLELKAEAQINNQSWFDKDDLEVPVNLVDK